MFGQGVQDRQANSPADKDMFWEVHWLISRNYLHFSSLYLPVFPVFVNHMKHLEAYSTLFHDLYTYK